MRKTTRFLGGFVGGTFRATCNSNVLGLIKKSFGTVDVQRPEETGAEVRSHQKRCSRVRPDIHRPVHKGLERCNHFFFDFVPFQNPQGSSHCFHGRYRSRPRISAQTIPRRFTFREFYHDRIFANGIASTHTPSLRPGSIRHDEHGWHGTLIHRRRQFNRIWVRIKQKLRTFGQRRMRLTRRITMHPHDSIRDHFRNEPPGIRTFQAFDMMHENHEFCPQFKGHQQFAHTKRRRKPTCRASRNAP